MKLVINSCYGGFGLSVEAAELYEELTGQRAGYDVARNDEVLVRVVENLGTAADGAFAELEVVEIPDDVDWEIFNYDGVETVVDRHRYWPQPE